MPDEHGQTMVGISTSVSGAQGPIIACPRGADGLTIERVHGSLAIQASDATAWAIATALIRRTLRSPILLFDELAQHDVLWSKVIANADMGAPTTHQQVNSFRVDESIAKRHGVTRNKGGSDTRGFQVVVEQDGAIPLKGILTVDWVIDWPKSGNDQITDLRTRAMVMQSE